MALALLHDPARGCGEGKAVSVCLSRKNVNTLGDDSPTRRFRLKQASELLMRAPCRGVRPTTRGLIHAQRALNASNMLIAFSINEDAHRSASALKVSVGPPVFLNDTRDLPACSAIERQLRMLQTAVDKASDAIFITEAKPVDEMDQCIIYANKAFTAMTGYSVEEVLGQTARRVQERCNVAGVADDICCTSKQSRSVKVELLDRRQ